MPMTLPFRWFVALGSPLSAFMNDNAITQPLIFIVQMINLIKKETVKITCHGSDSRERSMYNMLLKETVG